MASFKRLGIVVADRFFLLRPLVIVPAITFFLLGYGEAGARYTSGHGMFVWDSHGLGLCGESAR
jgi:hypothetical protein